MKKKVVEEDTHFLNLLSDYKDLEKWFVNYKKTHPKKKVVKNVKSMSSLIGKVKKV